MEGLKVRCQTCGTVLYETTEKYNCRKPLTGDMLRLLPLYKDWPTYDGALAIESTPRYLMFCSQCAGYISTTGRLTFVDFPDKTGISAERSRLADSCEAIEVIASVCIDVVRKTRCRIDGPIEICPDIEKELSKRVDDSEPLKAEQPTMTPKELMKELDKQANTSRPGPKKKRSKR